MKKLEKGNKVQQLASIGYCRLLQYRRDCSIVYSAAINKQ